MSNKITIIDAKLDKVIEREMTSQELSEHKMSVESGKARKADALEKVKNAKNALMALGLDEAIASQLAGVQAALSTPMVIDDQKS